MTTGLYSLALDYEGNPDTEFLFGTSQQMLVMIGKDHHEAASIKPIMTLRNTTGDVVAEMDEWSAEWKFVDDKST